jgi:hypothetical protein
VARSHAIETVIDVTPSKGVRARIEKLFAEYSLKAQALRITAEILDADDRQNAMKSAPQKFLQAINHRNGGRPTTGNRKQKPAKALISGKRLTLFLLEHLDAATPCPQPNLVNGLAAAGSPLKDGRGLSGALGMLIRQGWSKRNADGYRITTKGATHAKELRADLEQAGVIAKGEYLPPA